MSDVTIIVPEDHKEGSDAAFWDVVLGDDADVTTFLDDASSVRKTLKHLPGRHDQRRHGYRYGSNFGSYKVGAVIKLNSEQFNEWVRRVHVRRQKIVDKWRNLVPGVELMVGNVDEDAVMMVANSLQQVPESIRSLVGTVAIHGESGPEFVIPGDTKERVTGGSWTAHNKQLDIYNANRYASDARRGELYRESNQEAVDGIVFHEVGHAVHNAWWDGALAQAEDVYVTHPEWFYASGLPRPEFQQQYNALTPLARSRDKFTDAWSKGEDGITEYSKAWAKDGKWSETTAEFTKFFYLGSRQTSYRQSTPDASVRSVARASGAENLADAFLQGINQVAKYTREHPEVVEKEESEYELYRKFFDENWVEVADVNQAYTIVELVYQGDMLVGSAKYFLKED